MSLPLKTSETPSYANFDSPAFKKVRALRNPALALAASTDLSPSRGCGRRMNLGDITTRKLNDCGAPLLGYIRRDQYNHSGDGRFCKCFGKVRDFISCHFPTIWIRKLAIRCEDGHSSKYGGDFDASIRIAWPSDVRPRRMSFIGSDLAMRKRKKTMNESGSPPGRDINPIFKNTLQHRVVGSFCMPIKSACLSPRAIE